MSKDGTILAGKYGVKAWILRLLFGYLWLSTLSVCVSLDVYSQVKSVSSEEFQEKLPAALQQVEEFRFIREQAEKLGVRIWLFGGSAASFGNYVHWDLLRQRGVEKYQAEKFNYDFFSIFRGNQDLDLVIDGNETQAEALETIINAKFPYFKGGRSTWEVRLLRKDRGSKERLVGNPDFLKQDSDSASTGLFELTQPRGEWGRVVDLRDLEHPKDPIFLQDLLAGKIRLYDSEEHFETARFKEGKNPKILEAIRYLTKVFQFGYEPDPKDLETIREILRDFDPEALDETGYAFTWIQKNGVKLYENSIDVLRATQIMDSVGLRETLRAIKGDSELVGTLAWWMSKEPLKSFKVGGGGKKFRNAPTAKSLKLDLITHDTRSLTAWECMTRSPLGELNAFVSRSGVDGEAASQGKGFYCMPGKMGAYRTQLPVQLRIRPEAKLGWDFDLTDPNHPETSEIILKNRAAVTLEPQRSIAPLDYFSLLAGGGLQEEDVSKPLQRSIHQKYMLLTEVERGEIDELVRRHANFRSKTLVREWMTLPVEFLLDSHMSPIEYFQSIKLDVFFATTEKIPEALRTRIHQRYLGLSQAEREQINQIVRSQLLLGNKLGRSMKEDRFMMNIIHEWLRLPVPPTLTSKEMYLVMNHRWSREVDLKKAGQVFARSDSLNFIEDVDRYYQLGGEMLFPLFYLFKMKAPRDKLESLIRTIVDYYFPRISKADSRAIEKDLYKFFRQAAKQWNDIRGPHESNSMQLSNNMQFVVSAVVFSKKVRLRGELLEPFAKGINDDVFNQMIFPHVNKVKPEVSERWAERIVGSAGYNGGNFFSLLYRHFRENPNVERWIGTALLNLGADFFERYHAIASVIWELQFARWGKSKMGDMAMEAISMMYPEIFHKKFLSQLVTERYWRRHKKFESWMYQAIAMLGANRPKSIMPLDWMTADDLFRAAWFWKTRNVGDAFLRKWIPVIKRRADELGWKDCSSKLEELTKSHGKARVR